MAVAFFSARWGGRKVFAGGFAGDAAEDGDFSGQTTKALQFTGRGFAVSERGSEGAEVTGGEELSGAVYGFETGGRSAWGIGDSERGIADLLQDLPLGVAALFPVSKIWLVDGTAFEEAAKDVLNAGIGVEPVEESLAGLALFNATVYFLLEGRGELSDFSGAHGMER
jgi:hypothetical protein